MQLRNIKMKKILSKKGLNKLQTARKHNI